MTRPTPRMFFAVVLRPSRGALAVLVLLAASAAWAAVTDQDAFDQVCVLALFVQMFVASTGYRRPAAQGHFDPVLTMGTSRLACAGAHWAVSIIPGFVAWLFIGGMAVVFQPVRAPALLSASALIAVVYLSTVCWSATLPFQRHAAGVAWLALIFVLAAGHHLHSLREAFLAPGRSWADMLALARSALIVPVFLVTDSDAAGAVVLGALTAATALAWLAGAWFISRADGVLRDTS